MSPITPPGETRDRIFLFMQQRLLAGDPPTIREVQDAFGFRSVQTAREHLDKLVHEGRLVHQLGRSRGYTLPQPRGSKPIRLVPILGRIQAGNLNAAVEDASGFIPVQTRSTRLLFALRVQGESMRDAGILDGDLVVVRAQSTANPGDIVVALVGDDATVKTLRLRRGRAELHPANPSYAPIVPEGDFRILGTVIEVRRSLEPRAP
jgi:repressor LexA